MNMVEIWLEILTSQQVRRGVYHEAPQPMAAIEHFIARYNERVQPYVWTMTSDRVIAKATKRQGSSGTEH